MDTLALLDRIRHDWNAVAPELDTSPMVTFITLVRAASVLGEAVGETAPSARLNRHTRDLLFTLYRSAPADGIPAGELAALLAVTPAGVTGRIDRLEALGFVTRTLDAEDRRSWRIALSETGRRAVRDHLPRHLENERRLLSALSAKEVAQLEDLLRKLVRHAESDRDRQGL
jgi:DNA-binding MarR family transcriptional regulator